MYVYLSALYNLEVSFASHKIDKKKKKNGNALPNCIGTACWNYTGALRLVVSGAMGSVIENQNISFWYTVGQSVRPRLVMIFSKQWLLLRKAIYFVSLSAETNILLLILA